MGTTQTESCTILTLNVMCCPCTTGGEASRARLRAFARVFFACANTGDSQEEAAGMEIDTGTGEEKEDVPVVVSMIHKLHSLLTKLERFEVCGRGEEACICAWGRPGVCRLVRDSIT